MAATSSNPTTLSRSRERLLRQAQGDYGIGGTKVQTVAPDAAMYGVFQPQYAASLAAPTGAAGADVLNQMALRNNAQSEQERYGAALATAQAQQEKLQANEAYYGFMGDVRDDNINATDRGMGGYERVEMVNGKPQIIRDPILQSVGNSLQINESVADVRGKTATAISQLADAGIRTPVDTAANYMKHPLQTDPDHYGMFTSDQRTPEQETARYSADEGMTVEEQMEVERLKAESRDKGVQGEWSFDPVTQRYVWKVKGDIEDLQGLPGAPNAQGPPPLPNPKADARGGGASATPAAAPISNGRAVAEGLFPGVRVTQVRRDPKSKLGRANPSSWHNRSDAAIDVAPIRGMTFDQYVKRYRDAGYAIIEQRDEVRNPSSHATGPHWHVVLGQRVAQAADGRMASSRSAQGASNASALANRAKRQGLEAQMTQDGGVVVTLPNGQKRKYDSSGKRVS